MNFENSIRKYNVTNCKNSNMKIVDKQFWRDKIEFVGKETTEQADWPSDSLSVWVRNVRVITRLRAKLKPKLKYEIK